MLGKQAQKQDSRLIWWLQFCVRTNTPLPPPPPPHKTKSTEGLFNFIVKMLYCRVQADDLIGCIIIIMFEIINSQQEAVHHHYEMLSVIPQTLLHAGKSPFFRGVEDEQERFQKQCTRQAHRKQIYESAQICNLPTTPFQKPNKNNATVNCPDKLRVQFNSQSAY